MVFFGGSNITVFYPLKNLVHALKYERLQGLLEEMPIKKADESSGLLAVEFAFEQAVLKHPITLMR